MHQRRPRLSGKPREQVVHLGGVFPAVQDDGSLARRCAEGISFIGFRRRSNGEFPGRGSGKRERLVPRRKAVPCDGSAAIALHEYVNVAFPNCANGAAAQNGGGLTINANSQGAMLNAGFPRDAVECGPVSQCVGQAFDSSRPNVEVLIEKRSLE